VYLLNLSLFQFLAVFGSISALSVALYLLDRSRRKQVVSTLRFWVSADQPAAAARRRHISQPWSLILQLVSMALLILAIAQLRFGSPLQAGRDHVIILDVSAWMSARSGNDRTLMDDARARARRYLRAVPSRDRVMLVRGDALATPATGFEPDHSKVESAIDASQPGSTALNFDQALAFARHIQSEAGGRAGEIVYAGAGRIAEADSKAPLPNNLRALLVPDNVENAGLRKIGMRRSASDPDLWQIYIEARNYGAYPRNVNLAIDFGPPGRNGRTAAGTQRFTLGPGATKEATFEYRTRAAGILGVTLTPHDAFPADDHAELELPGQPSLAVTVYSDEPDLLRPVLGAAAHVTAIYRKPSEYRSDDRGLVILDRYVPPQRPKSDSIWIDPPTAGSPIPVRQSVAQAAFQSWNPVHPASAGLRAKDFKIDKASVFAAAAGDDRIGEVAAGPVIVARAGNPRIVVFGFHPALSALRYELTTPLLFANLLRWLSPEVFRRWEISGGSVGDIRQAMEDNVSDSEIKVTTEDGAALPFTIRDRTLDFFAGTPGVVRVVAGDREYVHSLTLPQLWDTRWNPPADVARGVPRFSAVGTRSSDLWPVLAVLGALGLVAEWLLYGRTRRRRFALRRIVFRRKGAAAAEVRR
jgi:hypothetical protein